MQVNKLTYPVWNWSDDQHRWLEWGLQEYPFDLLTVDRATFQAFYATADSDHKAALHAWFKTTHTYSVKLMGVK